LKENLQDAHVQVDDYVNYLGTDKFGKYMKWYHPALHNCDNAFKGNQTNSSVYVEKQSASNRKTPSM
jgi:hypothetical protein